MTKPARHYFAFAFVAETPALLLAAAAAGIALTLASRFAKRSLGVTVCVLWLVFPFAQ